MYRWHPLGVWSVAHLLQVGAGEDAVEAERDQALLDARIGSPDQGVVGGSVTIRRVSAQPNGPLGVTWLATRTPRLPLGRIRLRWEPASLTFTTNALNLSNRFAEV